MGHPSSGCATAGATRASEVSPFLSPCGAVAATPAACGTRDLHVSVPACARFLDQHCDAGGPVETDHDTKTRVTPESCTLRVLEKCSRRARSQDSAPQRRMIAELGRVSAPSSANIWSCFSLRRSLSSQGRQHRKTEDCGHCSTNNSHIASARLPPVCTQVEGVCLGGSTEKAPTERLPKGEPAQSK